MLTGTFQQSRLQFREQIGATLAIAETSSEAIRNLYRLFKGADKRYSMAWFCKKANIPSTGYFSDVINSKRTLHTKHREALSGAFQLNQLEQDYFFALLDRDNTKSGETDGPIPEHEEEEAAEKNANDPLATMRKNLLVRKEAIPEDFVDFVDAMEVFCAFALFDNTPNVAQLTEYFGDQNRVVKSLEQLARLKLVETTGSHQYRILDEIVLFGERPGSVSHMDFIRMSIARAAEDAPTWFPRSDESHIVSTLISVDSERYKELLKRYKQDILKMQTELESRSANQIIRFNVQIYPTRS